MISRRGFLRVIGVTSLTLPMGKLWIPERTVVYSEVHLGLSFRWPTRPWAYAVYRIDYGNGLVRHEMKQWF